MTSKSFKTFSRAAVALALLASPLSAQSVNLPAHESYLPGFGKNGIDTFGQTFTVNAGFTTLQNFTFWLSNDPGITTNASSLLFKAYIMSWDNVNERATGPVLFASTTQSGPTAATQAYNFATGNLALPGTGSYVAFLSAAGLIGAIGPVTATAAAEATEFGTYAGGMLVYTDSGNNFASLSTSSWLFADPTSTDEAHFTATIAGVTTTVPEPSSLILLASGITVLLAIAVKRKRA